MPTVDIEETPYFPTRKIYDPAGANPGGVVQGSTAEFSVVSRVPRIFTFESMVANTDADVQVRVNADAAWVTVVTIAGADGAAQKYTMEPRFNFVRIERTGSTGTADFIVYAQE